MLRHTLAVLAATATVTLGATLAQATSLSSLVAGGILTESDLVFDGFYFDDRFGDDATGGKPDRIETPFAGDRSVSASEVQITTTSSASSVTLTATIDPSILISGGTGSLPHIFDFFLDFNVSVIGASSRTITGVTLGGSLFATETGVSEIFYDIDGAALGPQLEIFEAPAFTPSSQFTDSLGVAATSFLALEGRIEGDTVGTSTAGLSTFSLTFDLAGTPPPPDGVVPVPPALPLALTAFAGLAVWRRARRA